MMITSFAIVGLTILAREVIAALRSMGSVGSFAPTPAWSCLNRSGPAVLAHTVELLHHLGAYPSRKRHTASAYMLGARGSPDGRARRQGIEQRPRLPQIGGVEAFGEPLVHTGQSSVGLLAALLRPEQARQAHGGTQLPRPGRLLARDVDRPAEAPLGTDDISGRGGQAELAVQPEELRFPHTLTRVANALERLADHAPAVRGLPQPQARAGQERKKVGQEQLRPGIAVAGEPALDLGDAGRARAELGVDGSFDDRTGSDPL